jgi:hypothetical protein
MSDTRVFSFPSKAESFLGALANLYAKKDKELLRRIVVNCEYRVHEGWTYDSIDGGSYGHALYFTVPQDIHFEIIDKINDVQNEICTDLNRLYNGDSEYISGVFIELSTDDVSNTWREDSGLLAKRTRFKKVSSKHVNRIWEEGCFRVFISHKAEDKLIATKLKRSLVKYGVSCFVAHEDIEPTQEWLREIECALSSMHAMIALITEKYFDGVWTNQEVGVAFALDAEIIPIRLGNDPRGFIGKIQALTCDKDFSDDTQIMKIFLEAQKTQAKAVGSLIKALEDSTSYSASEKVSQLFKYIKSIDPNQEKLMVDAFNNNTQVKGCISISGYDCYKTMRRSSDTIDRYMKKWTDHEYSIFCDGIDVRLERVK